MPRNFTLIILYVDHSLEDLNPVDQSTEKRAARQRKRQEAVLCSVISDSSCWRILCSCPGSTAWASLRFSHAFLAEGPVGNRELSASKAGVLSVHPFRELFEGVVMKSAQASSYSTVVTVRLTDTIVLNVTPYLPILTEPRGALSKPVSPPPQPDSSCPSYHTLTVFPLP